jgi:hypothetical protein
VAGLLLSYDTFNDLPRHVRTRDVGVLLPDGQLASLQQGGEFFLLTDDVEGALYAGDLQRLRITGDLTAWYNVADAVRLALFRFIDNILATPVFDPAHANVYLQR